MKYSELIKFEPITSVVKFENVKEVSFSENIVKTFVFSKRMEDDLAGLVSRNLGLNNTNETKGLQIVGNYGTGKSHLMLLISLIAENQDYLQYLQSQKVKESFSNFAGKYIPLRLDIANTNPLYQIIFERIQKWLKNQYNLDYSFDFKSTDSFKEQVIAFMAFFEDKFPNKGFLLVVDEMLEYLRSRDAQKLATDLMFIRSLGESCDKSNFKFMFGVQELIYRDPHLSFATEMLQRVEDRYDDLLITREDVAYIVKERLLKKDESQKSKIREHLYKFTHLYEDLQANFNEYVELFPVHPAYIKRFEMIKSGKDKRQILQTLSNYFMKMENDDVPNNEVGVITYDSYWQEISINTSLSGDIPVVKEKLETIKDKIDNYFTDARASRKPIAHRIVNACAISLLSEELSNKNGSTAKSLKDELCIKFSTLNDSDTTLDYIDTICKQIITATNGQFFDIKPDNQEYYIRIEGGRNFDQEIKDFANTIPDNMADQAFFDFMQFILGLNFNSYRTGFKIFQHSIEWNEKKHFKHGYIFFGNPEQKSTTHPIQDFYMYIMPIFSDIAITVNIDEVYFTFNKFSNDFKSYIKLYGAAKALLVKASSDVQHIFRSKSDEMLKKAKEMFEMEFIDNVVIHYDSKKFKIQDFAINVPASSKETIFSTVASRLLNDYFNEKNPDFPSFANLPSPNTKDNYDGRIKSAISRIIKPNQPNKDGEAILTGLGLLTIDGIDFKLSMYAKKIQSVLQEAGQNKVINRDDLIYCYHNEENLWFDKFHFGIDYKLLFVVLTALVYKGEITITFPGGKSINAQNIDEFAKLNQMDYLTFVNIKLPQGINYNAIRALFKGLNLPDLTAHLEQNDTYVKIVTEAKTRSEKVVRTLETVKRGIQCINIALLSEEEQKTNKSKLEALRDLLDRISALNSFGRIRQMQMKETELAGILLDFNICDVIENLKNLADKFSSLIKYLNEAKHYTINLNLLNDIEIAVKSLPAILSSNDKVQIKQYETLLNSLIDRYADHYVEQYFKFRLNQKEGFRKDAILKSTKKIVCDVLKDIDILNKSSYDKWIHSISLLKNADSNLTKDAVKQNPYWDFNPKEYENKVVPYLKKLEEELDELLDEWTNTINSFFNDPGVVNNIDLLEDSQRKLAEEFKNGKVEIAESNAKTLRDIVIQLSKGIERVELKSDDLKNVINKPLTPDDAVKALKDYIDKLCLGKERSKIRIILK